MKRTIAVAMAMATILMAGVANAEPPAQQEIQAPRGQEIQAPRSDQILMPRD